MADCYDNVIWLDGDSIITNPRWAIEDFIDSYHAFFISSDWGPVPAEDRPFHFNTGNLVVRKCVEAWRIFSHLWDLKPKWSRTWAFEQAALQEIKRTSAVGEWIAVRQGVLLNAVPVEVHAATQNPWERDCFLAHLTGIPNDRRIELLKAGWKGWKPDSFGTVKRFLDSDPRTVFMDRREEKHLIDRGEQAPQELIVDPDFVADFTAMPFADETFWHVVFDPPHCNRCSETGWLAKKYGKLLAGWEEMLADGFAECFRVLKPNGTLIFKWSSVQIPLSRVLALTPERPLYGHRSGANMKTHWVAFMKQNDKVEQRP